MKAIMRIGLSLFLSACSGSGATEATPVDDATAPSPSPESSAASNQPSTKAPDAGLITLEVHGKLVVRGTPVTGRAVRIVDAHGTSSSTTTDSAGAFRLSNVSPPYDLWAAGPAASPGSFFLGIHTSELVVPVVEDPNGPKSTPPAPATIHMTVPMPSCSTATCSLTVATTSQHGHGSIDHFYLSPGVATTEDVSHFFPVDGAAETADVHVLAFDSSSTHYWYAHTTTTAQPGLSTNVSVTLTSVGTFGPVTVTAKDADVPAEWHRLLDVHAVVGRAALHIGRVNAHSLVLQLPNIPGAEVKAWFGASVSSTATGWSWVGESVEGWSGVVPLLTPAIDMDAPRELAAVIPQRDSAVSASATRYEWQSGKPGSMCIVEVGPLSDTYGAQIFTNDSSIDLARVEKLGLPRRAPGRYSFDLRCPHSMTVDAFLSKTPLFDDATRGHESGMAFPFDVTP
jgi:hypothetical protein